MKKRDLICMQVAINAGFIKKAQWQEWADRSMYEEPKVPAWLYELSIATASRAALAALWEGIAQSGVSPEEIDRTSAHLGFLYLRYKAGELALIELLKQAGQIADGANYDKPSCEAFYILLNEIYGSNPIQHYLKTITIFERAEELFKSHVRYVHLLFNELAVQPTVGAC